MQIIKTIFQWVVYSSANPAKLSLTLKGISVFALTLISVYAGLAHIDISSITSVDFTRIVDAFISFIQAVATIASAVITVYGILRKVILTLMGRNKAI